MPLPSLAEIPQLQALQSQVRRLWAAQTVVVLALDRGLWIAWPSDQGWQVAAGSWPEGCCRDGMPLQREAMAELLADLLLDNDLMDAQVELLLPLAGVHWRVLDGIELGQFEQAKPALADLPWPLQPQESYIALTSGFSSMNRFSDGCLCCRTPWVTDVAASVCDSSRQTCSKSLVWHAFCPWR